MNALGLFAPKKTIQMSRVRRTAGRCSNCRKHKRAMLFIRGSQICALCVSKSEDLPIDSHSKLRIIRTIRRLSRA